MITSRYWKRSLPQLLLVTLLTTSLASAEAPKGRTSDGPRTALILDTSTRLDANSLEMFVYNNGNFAYDDANVLGRDDGLYFPRGTNKTLVYAAGLWVGAKVNGGIRLAISEYSAEFVPGPMAGGTFQPDSPEFHVYKINRGDDESNPDYANWPVDQGAPLHQSTEPLIVGDQMTWSVFNDADPAAHENDAGSTEPLGIEVQNACFGFARSGALGNSLFLKYTIINKGGNQLDSAYVSIWVDPDVGSAADDLVGCDTVRSLGYCYNEGADAVYGSAPPAVGFDFLQGPIVPGGDGDTAYVSGVAKPGYRNLPMASFNKYINALDPNNPTETFNYMKGLYGNGDPVVDAAGDTTRYAYAGDPVTGTGWVDQYSSDRRMMLSTGPFDMAPGDTQEVIVAVVVGQGSSPLSSISALRLTDDQLQDFFNSTFFMDQLHPTLELSGRSSDGAVELFWSPDMEGFTIEDEFFDQEFHFEGYNIFRASYPGGEWQRLATFDLVNDVTLIYNDVYNPDVGGIERVVVESGSNSGLQFHYVDHSATLWQTYNYAVTYYLYDVNHLTEFRDLNGNLLGYLTSVMESDKEPLMLTVQSGLTAVSDTAEHVAGSSSGLVIAEYVDGTALTGHDYRVTINNDNTWNLDNLTLNARLASHEPMLPGGYGGPTIDGIVWRVINPEPGVAAIVEVENGLGPVVPPDNVNYSRNSTDDWYLDPGGDHSLSRYTWYGATTHDYEIRFGPTASEHALGFFNSQTGDYAADIGFNVPIEFWDIGIGTPDNPSDDRRIAFMLLDGDLSDSFSWGDRLYIWDIDYDAIPWGQSDWHTGLVDPAYGLLHYGRWGFMDFSGLKAWPDPGTVVRTLTHKPMVVEDIYELHTSAECGDVNASGGIDITDAVFLINYIFGGGAAPAPGTADVNCDGKTNITDAVYLINYIFAYGPVPCANCPD